MARLPVLFAIFAILCLGCGGHSHSAEDDMKALVRRSVDAINEQNEGVLWATLCDSTQKEIGRADFTTSVSYLFSTGPVKASHLDVQYEHVKGSSGEVKYSFDVEVLNKTLHRTETYAVEKEVNGWCFKTLLKRDSG